MKHGAPLVLALLSLAGSLRAGQEREVTIPAFEGLELSGTLAVPPALDAGPAPAVLLLTGQGPLTDRNGNQPPVLVTDLMKQLSDRLTAAGLCVLRFDKRSVATHVQDWPAEVEAQGEFFRWEAYTGDAEAALAWLRARPEVDATRTAVLGHSEGGLLALQVGADLAGTEQAPAALVLIATASSRLDVVLCEEVEATLLRQNGTEALRHEFRTEIERAVESLVTEHRVPTDLHPGLRTMFPAHMVPLLASYFTLEPTELARACEGSVLVAGGALDGRIRPSRHLEPLAEAFEARAKGTVERLVVSGASHNLKAVTFDTEPGITGPVVPAALDGIAAFLTRALAR